MLAHALDRASQVSPGVRKKSIRLWYQLLSRLDTRALMTCMNYGYAGLDTAAPPIALRAEDEANRYCLQLYQHVAGALDLRGRHVLEVGSGRGGGAAYIARYLGPQQMAGVELASRAAAFCRRHYRLTGLVFTCGDAEALPFAPQSFDAVVNVESSHCYRDMGRFLREVARVLRPGGSLLFADHRSPGQLPRLREQFAAAGLAIAAENDITANVLRALELDSDRKQHLIAAHTPRLIRQRFEQFAGVKGSPIYEAFRSGALVYASFVLT
jgi:SAM-dependent methyltransferase